VNITLEDRVAVVTDSSFWVLDGHGRFRRTPRVVDHAQVHEGLAYADWDHLAAAEFVETTAGEFRLRVVPLGRPPGSVGLLSGAVRWTNVVIDPLYPERLSGPSTTWFPRSPVPGDEDLWPGELPFTAFGQFGPDALDLRVFDQDVYWVDRNGDPHHIDEMGEEYVANVVVMLVDRAGEFHNTMVVRETFQMAGDALQGKVSGSVIAAGLGIGSVADTDAATWLHSTPLMRRLLRTT
jgi:hypothetical protein